MSKRWDPWEARDPYTVMNAEMASHLVLRKHGRGLGEDRDYRVGVVHRFLVNARTRDRDIEQCPYLDAKAVERWRGVVGVQLRCTWLNDAWHSWDPEER